MTDPKTLEILDSVKSKLGMKERVELYVCQSVTGPMLVSLPRPVILLPPIRFEDEQIRLVLKHELIHLDRNDLWYKALTLAASALHWFNPTVYLMAKATAAQCEIACDAMVLEGADFEQRKEYGETIIGVLRSGAHLRTALSADFFGGAKSMKARLASMMDTTRKRTGVAVLCVVLLAVVGTGAVLVSWNGDEGPKTIDGVPIPSHILADEAMIMEYFKPRDVRWHVYQKEDGYEWYAIHYWSDRDGQEFEQWTIRGLSTITDEQRSWKFGIGFDVEDKAFYGSRSEGKVRNGGPYIYNIVAAGIVNDPAVAKVVGTTASGRTVSASPVNSCWYLIISDNGAVDWFTGVQALDEAGNVLHTLSFTTLASPLLEHP